MLFIQRKTVRALHIVDAPNVDLKSGEANKN